MATVANDRVRTEPLYLYTPHGTRASLGQEIVLEIRMSPDQYATLRRLAEARGASSQGFLLACVKEKEGQ